MVDNSLRSLDVEPMNYFLELIPQVCQIKVGQTNYGNFVHGMGTINRFDKLEPVESLLKAGIEIYSEVHEYFDDPSLSEQSDILFWIVYFHHNLPKLTSLIGEDIPYSVVMESVLFTKIEESEYDSLLKFLDSFAKYFRSPKIRSIEKRTKDLKIILTCLDLMTYLILQNKEKESDLEYLDKVARYNYDKLTIRHS
jgi:hypothetical protein